ncbi:MAG: CoA transferase [Clostridiales bacterium]|nr:CoA transferase [Clostridiales bacterium]
MANRTLEGIKVVEMSTFIAVPTCARFFADNGAEVVKVEAAGGDPIRWNGTSEGRPDDPYENTTFDLENANKRCIVLDLKNPEGKAVLFKLLENADVFLTNWRPQALAKNNLTYEQLHERFPKLVYGSLTGYGEKGPDKDLPGFDFTAFFARGGFLGSLYQKDTWPMNLIPGLGDHQAGMFLASGVMAALFNAQRTGCGEKVTTSLLHSSVFVQGVMLQAAQYTDIGNKYPIDRHMVNNPFNSAYRTKDGRFLQLAMPAYDTYYPKFMPLIGRSDLVGNTRYTMESITYNNLNSEFVDILSDAIETKTAKEWADIFTENDIPFSIAQVWEEVLEDPQAWGSDVFYKMRYDNGAERTLVRQPVFIGKDLPDYNRSPLLGEHSEEILRELGYDDEAIKKLHENNVFKTWNDLKAQYNG